MRHNYSVHVETIGTVYRGHNKKEARGYFRQYRELSRAHVGRAAGEDVTLFVDNELEDEFLGIRAMNSTVTEVLHPPVPPTGTTPSVRGKGSTYMKKYIVTFLLRKEIEVTSTDHINAEHKAVAALGAEKYAIEKVCVLESGEGEAKVFWPIDREYYGLD